MWIPAKGLFWLSVSSEGNAQRREMMYRYCTYAGAFLHQSFVDSRTVEVRFQNLQDAPGAQVLQKGELQIPDEQWNR